jgi:phosphoglycolate phosphatase-like HAD superfamily hydrolase
MSKLKQPEAIFFDVDGVLIDSLSIKGDAFSRAFSDYPEARDRIIAFHLSHGGVNRSEKITRLFRLIVGREPSAQEVAVRMGQFSDSVFEGVVAAPEIRGAHAALEEWSERVPLHAVSATPTDELRRILERRNIAKFFTSVHGWPPEKGSTVREVITIRGYRSSACILVGDSREDLHAAIATNVQFIQVSSLAASKFDESDVVISDLLGLTAAVEATMALGL